MNIEYLRAEYFAIREPLEHFPRVVNDDSDIICF